MLLLKQYQHFRVNKLSLKVKLILFKNNKQLIQLLINHCNHNKRLMWQTLHTMLVFNKQLMLNKLRMLIILIKIRLQLIPTTITLLHLRQIKRVILSKLMVTKLTYLILKLSKIISRLNKSNLVMILHKMKKLWRQMKLLSPIWKLNKKLL